MAQNPTLSKRRRPEKKGLRQPPEKATWLARLGKWISGASVVGALSLYLAYVYPEADELRKNIYQPLYSEIVANEGSMGGNLMTQLLSNEVLSTLQRTGNLQRVPRPLREKVVKLYADASNLHGDAWVVNLLIETEIVPAIKQLRTAETDRAWISKALERLNEIQKRDNRPSRMRTFSFTATHAWVSPAIDPRQPENPPIVLPGGPIWQINDWMGFPRTAQQLDPVWMDTDLLRFHSRQDTWDFRITREDLQRHGTNLVGFLTPIYNHLMIDSHFRDLADNHAAVLKSFEVIKAELVERIRQPKRLADLIGQ